jgi:hypothetical protein
MKRLFSSIELMARADSVTIFDLKVTTASLEREEFNFQYNRAFNLCSESEEVEASVATLLTMKFYSCFSF